MEEPADWLALDVVVRSREGLEGLLNTKQGTRVVFWVRCIEVAREFHGG